MDYEEYKKKLKKVKEVVETLNELNDSTIARVTSLKLQNIFPEVCESEDEKIRKGIIELVKQSSEILDKKNQERMLAWLEKQADKDKLIKELGKYKVKYTQEVLSQQLEKQSEWSEVDKTFMYYTLSNLTELKDRYGEVYGNVGKCIDWIKSLKDRVQPQNGWKPSKEQIIALRWVLNNIPYNKHKEEISGLLDQIKDL